MSLNHVAFAELFSAPEVEVYRVGEFETVSTMSEVVIAIAVLDRSKDDISVVPCGPWSGEPAIESVRKLFDASKVTPGRMPTPPYGGKRMLYLLAEAQGLLSGGPNRHPSSTA